MSDNKTRLIQEQNTEQTTNQHNTKDQEANIRKHKGKTGPGRKKTDVPRKSEGKTQKDRKWKVKRDT